MRNPAEAILCLTESRSPARWYKRLSCGEDEMPPWLSPSCATREQGCCAIRRTYESMLESLHLLPADDACGRGIPLPQDMRSYGCSWVVDPRHGEGGYWYVVVDADAVVVCMDLSLRERAVHRGHSIELIGFGLYEHDMPSYFVEGLQPRRPALIGYRWGRQSYQQTI